MLLHLPKEPEMSFKYDLTVLQERDHLINFLGVDAELFEKALAFDPRTEKTRKLSDSGIPIIEIPLFYRHEVPKKNGRGHRTVWETFLLKSVYKALARRLGNFFSYKLESFPHPRTFGYVGGRNIKESARDHCGHKYLLSVDLKDFFPSIKTSRIRDLLESSNIAPPIADLLSRFVTIDGTLPLGLATSPVIANAICLPMDRDLAAIAQNIGATFSRYADDISFSSNDSRPSQEDITACIQRHEFEISKSKTRISKLGQAHYVTGLSISDPTQPHIPRKKKRRLRQELHYAGKYGLDNHFHHLRINDHRAAQHEVNRLDGLVKFTAYHEPKQSTQLKSAWATILKLSGYQPSFEPKNQSKIPFCIFIDEAEYVRPDGNRVLALAMASSQHQDQINQATSDVQETITSDVWVAGNRDVIAKKGLHFSDASQDMRLTYVERMRSLPFEGYVAMAQLHSNDIYEAVYLKLLNAMIKRRLMAAESQFAYLFFEQNDKVNQETVRKTVTDAHDSLKKSNNRRPMACGIDFVGKPNLGMSVPDFLLGILGRYLASGLDQDGRPPARDKLLFERVRDKYRLILDVDNWTEYSRRRPIAPW